MRKMLYTTLLLLAGLLFGLSAAHAEKDAKGSKDHPLFTRMTGWYISSYESSPFAAHEFTITDGEKMSVEGPRFVIGYSWGGQGAKSSSLQVIRNYENALKAIGGSILYKRDDNFLTMKLTKDGKEIWAEIASEVDAGWGGYILTVVEKGTMEQEVTANAATMGAGIKETGHMALYGILFDTGKADIKPESDPVLAEIAKLLQQETSLQLYVVGHTDNVGTAAANIKLSQARAEAVKTALTGKYGVQATRLSAFGAGPYCPVSTNATDAGRAKNRRVELVQQ